MVNGMAATGKNLMTQELNPYQSPAAIIPEAVTRAQVSPNKWMLLAWPAVLVVNGLIPALFGWVVTEHHGRLGSVLATTAILVLGWRLCYQRPLYARRLIIGAAVFSLSQFFPFIQILAGMIAMQIASRLGLTNRDPDVEDLRIASEFGGFLVTAIVGAPLIACSACIGWLLGLLFGDRKSAHQPLAEEVE